MLTREQIKEIDHAKSILRGYGYYVENMWNVADVQQGNDVPDDDAYEILDSAISSEHVFEYIWAEINSQFNLKA